MRNSGFVKNGCKYTNCYTTNLQNKLVEKENGIDTLVVYGWDDDKLIAK